MSVLTLNFLFCASSATLLSDLVLNNNNKLCGNKHTEWIIIQRSILRTHFFQVPKWSCFHLFQCDSKTKFYLKFHTIYIDCAVLKNDSSFVNTDSLTLFCLKYLTYCITNSKLTRRSVWSCFACSLTYLRIFPQ